MSLGRGPTSDNGRVRFGRRRHLRGLLVLVLGLAFAGWTWLTLGHLLPGWVDSSQLRLHLRPDTRWAEISTTIALDTHPVVLAVLLAGLAVWAWRRRLRNISVAIVIGVLLAWPLDTIIKLLARRPRPTTALESLTFQGFSYPSTHTSMATAAAILVIATTTTTRQSRASVFTWRIIGVLSVMIVAYDRWLTNAHWVSDIIGGWLLGLFAAVTGLVVAGVRMLPDLISPPKVSGERPVCAVIHNPTKVTDMSTFRRHIDWELTSRGWYDALWLQTTRDDPGVAMTLQAVEAGVDLVIVAGGDGTVRAVCSGLAGTGIPLAIVPAGTGNLLARNLGIPLDEPTAVDVAFGGVTDRIDLVRVRVDDQPPTHFAVMAGLGIDARILSATNLELKRAVGSAAYFIAAAQQATIPATPLRYRVDDQPPVEQEASLALVGNVGLLQGNIQMFPRAQPNDGRLDVMVASTTGRRDWAQLVGRVLLRLRRSDPRVTELTGRHVSFEVPEPVPFELDGDTGGVATRFDATIERGALTIRLPRRLPAPVGVRRTANARPVPPRG